MAQFNIVNGPSKWDIILSLFDGDSTHRKSIEFGLALTKERISLIINGLERESGNGESWNFTGHWLDCKEKVYGYYSTRTRNGWLSVGEKPN